MSAVTRETAACISLGHGFIPTADGPVYARRLRTAWWLAGRCDIDMRGDAGNGYCVVGATPAAGAVLLYNPSRLYRAREKAATAAKRFHQPLTPCERPDVETMGVSSSTAFYQVVVALYGASRTSVANAE